jgi:putative flippase GtrA
LVEKKETLSVKTPSPAGDIGMQNRLQRLPGVAALINHIPPGQFGRYLLVGIGNTLFAYSTFAAFTAILDPIVPHGYGYIVAAAVSSCLSINFAFLAYKWFVFKTKGNYLREWVRCVAVYGSNTLLNLIMLPVLVEGLRHVSNYGRKTPYIAGALLTAFTVVYSFVGHRKFSFRPAAEEARKPPPDAA